MSDKMVFKPYSKQFYEDIERELYLMFRVEYEKKKC